MSKIDIQKVMDIILADAENRRLGAGMDGRFDDGGADSLLTQVEYYRYGVAGVMPPSWYKYEEQAVIAADPEYETYQRLKAKFEDR